VKAVSSSVKLAECFYQMEWKPLPLSAAPKVTSSAHWLILSDRQAIGQQLSMLLEAQGETTTLLRLSTPQQLKALLSLLLEATEHPCRGVVYLSALDQLPLDLSMPQLLASEIEHQLHTVVTVIQTLAEVKHKPSPRLWLVTQGAQPVQSAQPLAVGQAPLWRMGDKWPPFSKLYHKQALRQFEASSIVPPFGRTRAVIP
jgi:hypothetical protein